MSCILSTHLDLQVPQGWCFQAAHANQHLQIIRENLLSRPFLVVLFHLDLLPLRVSQLQHHHHRLIGKKEKRHTVFTNEGNYSFIILLIFLTSLNSKELLLEIDDWHKNKRIFYWPPYANTVYNTAAHDDMVYLLIKSIALGVQQFTLWYKTFKRGYQ